MAKPNRRNYDGKSDSPQVWVVGRRFFKVLMGDFQLQLSIPPAFFNHLEASFPHAILKGPSNNIWHAEIQKNELGMAITKGWELFCRDHSLEVGDFLVFKYDGDMQFSIQVFDKTACEKEDAFHASVSKRKVSLGDCKVEAQTMDDTPLTSEVSEKSSGDASNRKKRKRSQCSQQEKNHGPKGQTTKASSNATPRAQYKIVSQRREVTNKERQMAIKAANAFRSNRPYCTIVMKPYHVNFFFFLKLPADFRNKYIPYEKVDLTLWDPDGVPWPVRYISLPPKNKTRGLSAGWIPFLYANSIEEGDVCIFELIKPKEMRVHIFRVVKEVVPLLKGRNIKC